MAVSRNRFQGFGRKRRLTVVHRRDNAAAGHLVTGNWYLDTASAITGRIKAYLAGTFTAKPIKVWTGSTWTTKPLKRWTGSTWTQTTY